jgi:predicted MPP superfamily phosphohydrolase
MLLLASALLCAAGACLVYGWFEAGWLRTRVLDVEIEGLAVGLDGLRIAHLSDFHLGAPLSRGNRASATAVAWVAKRRPDVVCITGDLVSHPRGESRLRALIQTLERPIVVLGNHDVAVTRDPFSRAAELRDLEHATLLTDEGVLLQHHREQLLVVGVDPMSYRDRRPLPDGLVEGVASFRLLLCHFPGIVDRVPSGSFDLTLAGHLHAGQICLPTPRGKLTLAHPRARFVAGVYRTSAGLMHVSPGTGTTFVPLRFFARPEVTELVLRQRH